MRRQRVELDQVSGAQDLVRLLVQQDRLDEAITLLDGLDRPLGWQVTGHTLEDLLVQPGRVDELRARAERGNISAGLRLAQFLEDEGHTEEPLRLLRELAGRGDYGAADQLARLLVREERMEELRALAGQGEYYASFGLAQLLLERGEKEEAIRLLRKLTDQGASLAASLLLQVLDREGRRDQALLRKLADQGNLDAVSRLMP